MGIRDHATDWWLRLYAIKVRLSDLDNADDSYEMIDISRDLVEDLETVLELIDSELELDMENS